mgnify:FL=1|jgi:3-methyl-2-oxobutanoate hydroxymethyltransferase
MKLSAAALRKRKFRCPIAVLTAYTTPVAQRLERAGVPVLLVGDTVGMVEMGFSSTREVTLEHMEYHIGGVRRGAPGTHIIGDLPFDSDRDPDRALRSARRLLAAGADSVKLEGPKLDVIRHLVAEGVDVVGHTGLTPQTAASFRQVGVTPDDAGRIRADAEAIAAAGAFMIVLEHVPDAVGRAVTQAVPVPTIGIGAGADCDGQVLVINDVLRLGDRWPPFSRQYADMGEAITQAGMAFRTAVETRRF